MTVTVIDQHIHIEHLTAVLHRVAVLDFDTDKETLSTDLFDSLGTRGDLFDPLFQYRAGLGRLLIQFEFLE